MFDAFSFNVNVHLEKKCVANKLPKQHKNKYIHLHIFAFSKCFLTANCIINTNVIQFADALERQTYILPSELLWARVLS